MRGNVYLLKKDYENAVETDTRRIEYVYAPSGKRLEFDYRTATDLIEEIHDPMGRKIIFDYSGVTSTGYYKTPVLIGFED